jgi:hypothetical protein
LQAEQKLLPLIPAKLNNLPTSFSKICKNKE